MTADLRALGAAESGVLLVHSSLSSLGWVCPHAEQITAGHALEERDGRGLPAWALV